MDDLIILHGISVDDLLKKIDFIIEKRLNEKIEKLERKEKPGILTRKEAAASLKISLPTLDDLAKKGIIPSYRLGARILFKSDEIHGAITKRKFKF